MNIFKLIFRAPRPNTVSDMPASVNRFFCRKNYAAITMFGFIFTHDQDDADLLNNRVTYTKNHEMIHLRQAQSTHNSWFCFYMRYLWYVLTALRYSRKVRNAGYYLNPFEMEAYTHMYDLHYLDHSAGHGTSEWRRYAKMSLRDRLVFIRQKRIV